MVVVTSSYRLTCNITIAGFIFSVVNAVMSVHSAQIPILADRFAHSLMVLIYTPALMTMGIGRHCAQRCKKSRHDYD